MATIKKASKGTMSPKSSNVSSKLGSYGKKMKSGGSLGMKSVKAGFDKNPGVTRADIIIGAKKGQAKKGKMVKKAQTGTTQQQAAEAQKQASMKRASDQLGSTYGTSMKKGGFMKKSMKTGGKMKKCAYGCK